MGTINLMGRKISLKTYGWLGSFERRDVGGKGLDF